MNRYRFTLAKAMVTGMGFTAAGCQHPPVQIDKPSYHEVPVYVDRPVNPERIKDCAPDPLANTTLRAIEARLSSVESQLKVCRCELALLRGETCQSP